MLHDIADVFNNHWDNHTPDPQDLVLAFNGDSLLMMRTPGGLGLPTVRDILSSVEQKTLRKAGMKGAGGRNPEFSFANVITAINNMFTYLFSIGTTRYFLVVNDELKAGLSKGCSKTPEEFEFHPSSEFRAMSHDLSFVCQVSRQLNDWYESRRFCGRCGSKTELDNNERMIRCPKCGTMEYPKICPGVIVGIVHEGKLLMSRYVGRPYTSHALIAGFSEIGEPIEDTVRREVAEEVGLKVKNITFYGSQPWPPSSSLLVGFFCELDGSGEITLDTSELADAAWYAPEDVPSENDNYSLTRDMMVFFHNHGHEIEKMIHDRSTDITNL